MLSKRSLLKEIMEKQISVYVSREAPLVVKRDSLPHGLITNIGEDIFEVTYQGYKQYCSIDMIAVFQDFSF